MLTLRHVRSFVQNGEGGEVTFSSQVEGNSPCIHPLVNITLASCKEPFPVDMPAPNSFNPIRTAVVHISARRWAVNGTHGLQS